MLLNFYSTATNILLVIQFAAWSLPITFLAVLFYAGLAAMIALAVKNTITSALVTVLAGFFVWFITTLTPDVLGALADYVIFTPYKAPIVALGRVLGKTYLDPGLETALPAWGYIVLILFYAVVFLVPTYLYFTRKFEVKE